MFSPRNFMLLAVAALLAAAPAPALAQEKPARIQVDTTQAPECADFARRALPVAEEWYPRINELLFGKGHPLPRETVKLTFRPMKGVAHAAADGIHISAEWVTKKAPNDLGMVVHELVHIVQDYRGRGEGWLTEGIADYIRYEFYEPGKQKWKLDPAKSSYKQGYGIAGAFLAWLEKHKHAGLVRQLNEACHDGRYRPEMFAELCGAPLDPLWAEYLAAQTAAQ